MHIYCVIVVLLYITVVIVHSSGASLQSQQIDIVIKDRYAFITYLFQFSNTDNNNSVELSYEITLQPHTFISYFFAELNGHIFRGETKEKLEALNEYNSAVELGLNAILVSQNHDANVFTIQANIEASGTAILNITAERFILRKFGYYELSLLISNAYGAYIQTEFDNTPININLYDEFSAISFTDVIVPIHTDSNINKISSNQYYIDVNVPNAGDSQPKLILFRYKTASMDNNNQLLYDSESSTFMHIFSYEDKSVLPRRCVFVLDRSGSMAGTKWESAVAATIGALQNLNVGVDRMNIILFDNEFLQYSTSMVQVTDSVIQNSIDWIKKYKSGGATNLYGAVTTGLDLLKNDIDFNNPFEFVNQIVVITDGKPTAGTIDPIDIQTGILDANDELKPAMASIFCLGIGRDYGNNWVSDLNYPLLRSIATQNDGFDARIKESETETILSDYYNILKSPVLSFIVLDYRSNNGINTVNSLTQHMFRGLYSGTDIVVCGKTVGDSTTDIYVTLVGNRGGIKVSRTIPMAVSNNNDAYVIDRIWAYLKLKTYRRKLDNPRLDMFEKDILQVEALELALLHQFVTPWTSMIAVDYTVDFMNETNNNSQDADDTDLDGINPAFKSPDINGTTKESGIELGGILVVIFVVIMVVLVIIIGFIIYYRNRKKSVTVDSGDNEEAEIALQEIGNPNNGTCTGNITIEEDTKEVTYAQLDNDQVKNETDEEVSE